MKIRLTGQLAELIQGVDAIRAGGAFEVLHFSEPKKRRNGHGWDLYLNVRITDPPPRTPAARATPATVAAAVQAHRARS